MFSSGFSLSHFLLQKVAECCIISVRLFLLSTIMTFNATTVAAAAAHAAQTTTQQLYANIDLTKLSWLEQMWAAWYIWIDNPIIATGLMSFLLHEVFFFAV